MKKPIMILGMLATTFAFGQENREYTGRVGINTDTPKATLDVVGVPTNTEVLDGIIAPRLTGDQLNAKTYTAEQLGALVFVTAVPSNGKKVGQTANVDSIGYYYYDGSVWQKQTGSSSAVSSNLYTANGILQSDRVVTMNDKTLKFSGNTTSLLKDGEALSVKNITSGEANYMGFYKRGDIGQRSGYLGFGSQSNNNFNIKNELGDVVTIGTSSASGTTIVENNLRISTLAEGNATTEKVLVADTNGNVKKATLPTYTAGTGISISNGQISTNAVSTNLYSADGNLAGNRTVTMGNNTLKFTGNTTSFVKNAEVLSLKNTTSGESNYIGFYKQGDTATRNAYVGFESSSNNDFAIKNELGNVVSIAATGTNDNPALTELKTRLKINNLPVEHNTNNALIVTDQNGNIKKANLYQAGSGISIDASTNTISTTGNSSNIYSADGDLAGNRTVNMGDYALTFSGGANSGLIIENTAGTPNSIQAALQIKDGSQKNGYVLTSDDDGIAKWTSPVIPTDVIEISEITDSNNQKLGNFVVSGKGVKKTDLYLNVQPGKWIFNIYLGVSHKAVKTSDIGTTFIRLRFIDEDQYKRNTAIDKQEVHPMTYKVKFASLGLAYTQTQGVLVGALGIDNKTNKPIKAYIAADIEGSTKGYNGTASADNGKEVSLLFTWKESTIIGTPTK